MVSKKRPSRSAPEEVRDGEGHEIERRGLRRHLVEGGEAGREREDRGVVDERLRRHQREAEQRAARVAAEHGLRDLAEAGALPRLELDLVARLGQLVAAGRFLYVVLDLTDDPLGLVVAAVQREPARALGHVAAHEQNAERQDRPHPNVSAPADVRVEQVRIQQDRRDGGAERGAQPVAAVDGEVDPAAHPCRDQLVDGRVDGGVLAADAEAGEEAADREEGEAAREGGRHRCDEIDGQRDQEELLAPEAIGEMAPEERTRGGADDVDRPGEPKLPVGDPERVLLGEARADRADDRDLEPVEDPDGAEPEDDQPVPGAPWEPVHARWDARADRALVVCLHREAPLPRQGWPNTFFAQAHQPSTPVDVCGAPTGFDSGDPRWRRYTARIAIEPTARNSDCQFWSVLDQKSGLPM